MNTDRFSRRNFLRVSLAGAATGLVMPTLVPSSIFGAGAPSKVINVGQIGCGRIARDMDLPGIMRHSIAQVVAVCDVDSKRLQDGKNLIEDFYSKQKKKVAVRTYSYYGDLLKDARIDAVAISTPDHWHAEPVIAAALAGKDVYVQKPLTMTLAEGRAVSTVLTSRKTAFQIGSQQRSGEQFRIACELVRNGRIGQLQTVKIGLPTDPAGGSTAEQQVPPNLNYDMWLGSTPMVPYNEDRVHPQRDYSRPGYLRIEAHCLGMITGWGSHHVDIGHWGMNTELTGPVEAEARAEFPKQGLWDVHGAYHIEMNYSNGVKMVIDNTFTSGIRFEGSEGWIFVSRGGAKTTASDPATAYGKALEASDPKILRSKLGSADAELYRSEDHHLNWLQSIQTRKPAVTTPEQAHRSTSACILGWIAMKLGRKLRWDPIKEQFINDAEANAMLTRAERAPYGALKLAKNA